VVWDTDFAARGVSYMPIRLRLVLVFTVLATITTSLGGWFLVGQLHDGLVSSLDQSISVQWTQVQLALGSQQGQENFQESGGKALGSSGPTRATLFPPETQYVVQVFDKQGRLAETNQAAGNDSLLSQSQVRRAERGSIAFTVQGPSTSEYRLLAGPSSLKNPRVVVVGASLDTIGRSVSTVRRDLLLGGIAIVLLIMFGSYLLATSALSPVERLRRQVEELSVADSEVPLRVPKSRDEIAALARTMNSLLERLHRALSRQRSFVADAGHELRTPFAILQTELELAARPGRSREELQEAVERASYETARLTRLAEDLLFLARSDELAAPMELASSSIREVLTRAAALSHHRADEAGVTLKVNAPVDLEVTMDAGRLRQAIDNLIENALRFSPQGGEITIAAGIVQRDVGVQVRIDVSDHGPGFSNAFLPHAFTRFSRPDDGRARSEGGAGLGLAVVASIAASHGGYATATNLEGGGAIVSIIFPSDHTSP
jgi:two-component system OmpR family sensor kinase